MVITSIKLVKIKTVASILHIATKLAKSNDKPIVVVVLIINGIS